MFNLPPLAPWNGMHVLIVHFPIALLTFTPVMIVAAILFRKWGRQFAAAAGFLLIAGTIAAQVAIMSGEAAEHLAKELAIDADPEASELLEHHSEAAEAVRNIFAMLTVLYWGYLAATGLSKRKPTLAVDISVLAVFVILTGVGALALANAAHMGGELVHSHGILAPLDKQAADASAEAAKAAAHEGTDDDEDD